MSADPRLMKMYLKNLLAALEAKAAEQPQHCLREDGSERLWWDTAAECEAFIRDPRNVRYKNDRVVFCTKCRAYHASDPSWAEYLPWEIPVKAIVN
jgi:hypothetical protein